MAYYDRMKGLLPVSKAYGYGDGQGEMPKKKKKDVPQAAKPANAKKAEQALSPLNSLYTATAKE